MRPHRDCLVEVGYEYLEGGSASGISAACANADVPVDEVAEMLGWTLWLNPVVPDRCSQASPCTFAEAVEHKTSGQVIKGLQPCEKFGDQCLQSANFYLFTLPDTSEASVKLVCEQGPYYAPPRVGGQHTVECTFVTGGMCLGEPVRGHSGGLQAFEIICTP